MAMCSVEDCEQQAILEVILYDFYPGHLGGSGEDLVFFQQDLTCPYICGEHAVENERQVVGERKPRAVLKYPYTNRNRAQGFTIYRPLDEI